VAPARGTTFLVDVREGTTDLLGPGGLLPDSLPGAATLRWNGAQLFLHASHDAGVFVGGKRVDGELELSPGDDVEASGCHLVVGIAAPFLQPQRRSFTHAELDERIAEELARAARAWRPTALAMVRARHGEGGRVLEAGLEGLRAGDCVATFAPDEIEMLLPDTTRERAERVVQRTLDEAGVGGAIVGIAVAPEDADGPALLLRAARLALRAASGSGPPPTARACVFVDQASKAARDALLALTSERAVLVRGELHSGRSTLIRAALESAVELVRVSCARLEADAIVSVPDGAAILLEDVDRLAPELRDAVVHRFAGHRVIATSERALDARWGALGLWLGAGARVVEVPPLRQRLEDIHPIALALGLAWSGREPRFSAPALARLRSYPWPGNLVELEVAIERAMLLAGDGDIQAEHLPGTDGVRAPGDGRLREHVDSVERDAIVRALAEANHNQTSAARKLGLSRRGLIYKMEKYGLKPPPTSAAKGRRRGPRA
jgi:two-component system, NtrC family, response regulator AtoC